MSSDRQAEKLVGLLSAKNGAVRRRAADAIGEWCRTRPTVGGAVLHRLLEPLAHPNSDVRYAAALAASFVLPHVRGPLEKGAEMAVDGVDPLTTFDALATAASGRELLGAASAAYRLRVGEAVDERRQRVEVNRQLGLNPRVGVDCHEWVSDVDLRADASPPSSSSEDDAPSSKKRLRIDAESAEEDPLAHFLSAVTSQLGAQEWARRHGAAVALQKCAAHLRPGAMRRSTLLRLFQVLALDRFSDFVGTCATAPVREACARAVAHVCAASSEGAPTCLTRVVSSFLRCDQSWECRQSGLLLLEAFAGDAATDHVARHFADDLLRLMLDGHDEVAAAATRVLQVTAPAESAALCEAVWSLLCRLSPQLADDGFVTRLLQLAERCTASASSAVSAERCLLLLGFCSAPSAASRLAAFSALRLVLTRMAAHGDRNLLKRISLTTCRRILIEPPSSSTLDQLLSFWHAFVEWADTFTLVDQLCDGLGGWLACLMTPDDAVPLEARVHCLNEGESDVGDFYLCGSEIRALEESVRHEEIVIRKFAFAEFLAELLVAVDCCGERRLDGQSPSESLRLLLQLHLTSNSLLQRAAVGFVLNAWSQRSGRLPSDLLDTVDACLQSPPAVFDEQLASAAELSRRCTDFLGQCAAVCAAAASADWRAAVTTVDEAQTVCGAAFALVEQNCGGAPIEGLRAAWTSLSAIIAAAAADSARRRLNCLLAAVLVRAGRVPDKLNALIAPLMETIKFESCDVFGRVAATALTALMLAVESRPKQPNAKLIRNLVVLHSVQDGRAPSTPCSAGAAALACTVEIELHDICERRKTSAACALEEVVRSFGASAVDRLSTLREALDAFPNEEVGEVELHYRLRTLDALAAHLPLSLFDRLRDTTVSGLCGALAFTSAHTRWLAVRCLVSFAERQLARTLATALPWCSQRVDALDQPSQRAGIVQFLWCLVQQVDAHLVDFVSILCPLVLGRLSDSHPGIRQLASRCFSHLVRLMPLEADDADAALRLPACLLDQRREGRALLATLSSPSTLPPVDVVGLTGVQLRPYQVEGVTWLCGLCRFRLHGILADDMGLGKTLQTLCAVTHSYAMRRSPYPSLVVCPNSLTNHWLSEVGGHFALSALTAAALPRNATSVPSGVSLVVASYEQVRRFASVLAAQPWHYCVLDEGHVIRNPNTQLFGALRALVADHRLILSGTPIQNCVAELWSLFEFLMPGYLGEQKAFDRRFTNPVRLSRDADAATADESAAQSALERLHKMTLPFIMRRLKTDVLRDLPPKIVQDYYCQLTPTQTELYEAATRRLQHALVGDEQPARNETLSCLMQLRKICDHPALAAGGSGGGGDVTLEQSGKLVALREVLADCGIVRDHSDVDLLPRNGHRALVFCQFRACVDLLCRLLLAGQFGRLSWLRLDGSVAPNQRQGLVDQFNEDTSIDLMLLTTQVGGLGLNLTGADVVVFIDHDWNPVKDLQAMDRAHRLGQQRTVNVYRLITKGTVEEKIMRLQKFKVDTANVQRRVDLRCQLLHVQVVIGEDNRSLQSLASDQLLDLICFGDAQDTNKVKKQTARQTTHKWNVADLWDDMPNGGDLV